MNKRVLSDLLFAIALILSLFISVFALPGFGLAAGLMTPVAIAYYIRKLGWIYGALPVCAALLVISATAGIKIAAIFIAEFAAMGMALSEAVRLRLPLGRGVLLPASVSLAGSLVLLFMFAPTGNGFHAMVEEQVRRNVGETVAVYSKVGLPAEQVEGLKEFTKKLETVILKTYPSLAFVGILSTTVFNLLFLKGLLRRKGIEDYQVEPSVWSAPEPLVWLLISGGLMLMLKMEWAWTLGLNLLIVTGSIYFFQGMAIVSFFFNKMGTPLFMRSIGYFLIIFQQIFTVLVIGFGLFDLWFDFRRLKKTDS